MGKKPFDGLKVVDFSQVLAAPFCGMLLADLGAEVIKVERIKYGDISREYGPYLNDVSLYFCQYNRGKKSIAIDLRTDEGKQIIIDLVRDCDIVIENYKAGTLEKLGLGYEELLKVNPELIYGSICGFGLYGPLSHLPCMDIIAAARSGLVDRSGEAGGVPIKPGFSMCDTWAGIQLLRGLSMALLNKQKTGRGTRIDIAMLDCAFYMSEWPVLEHGVFGTYSQRTGNHDARVAPYGEFTAKDGYVVLAITNEEEWKNLCAVPAFASLGKNAAFATNTDRVKNRDKLIAEIDAVTTKMGRYDFEKTMIAAKVPGVAIQTIGEFMNSEQGKALKIVTHNNQKELGDFLAVGNPIKFSKTPVDTSKPSAAYVGQHTEEILSGIARDAKNIKGLMDKGIVHGAELV